MDHVLGWPLVAAAVESRTFFLRFYLETKINSAHAYVHHNLFDFDSTTLDCKQDEPDHKAWLLASMPQFPEEGFHQVTSDEEKRERKRLERILCMHTLQSQ